MHPLHERKVLHVTPLTCGHDPDRNQERPPKRRSICATQTLLTRAPLPSRPEEGQILHDAFARAVMPSREANERDMLVGVADASTRFTEVRRQPKVTDTQSCLQTLFGDDPLVRTALPCKWPGLQTCGHQRLVSRKVNHGADTEGAHELGAADGFLGGHVLRIPLAKCVER